MTENGEWEANAGLAHVTGHQPLRTKKGVPLPRIML